MLVELTEFLVKNIVKNPDMVSVKQLGDDEEIITIQILVEDSDMSAVIGKGGAVANSIRTIVQACSYKNNLPKVKIDIDSF